MAVDVRSVQDSLFCQLDQNWNGRIERDELPKSVAAQVMDRLDTNRDGVLTKDELFQNWDRLAGTKQAKALVATDFTVIDNTDELTTKVKQDAKIADIATKSVWTTGAAAILLGVILSAGWLLIVGLCLLPLGILADAVCGSVFDGKIKDIP
jgi:hypothetical protein